MALVPIRRPDDQARAANTTPADDGASDARASARRAPSALLSAARPRRCRAARRPARDEHGRTGGAAVVISSGLLWETMRSRSALMLGADCSGSDMRTGRGRGRRSLVDREEVVRARQSAWVAQGGARWRRWRRWAKVAKVAQRAGAAQRIDIALRIRSDPNAEMDVRDTVLRLIRCPIAPTPGPSSRHRPLRTEIRRGARASREYPSSVSIVTTLPFAPTDPANVTTPPAGASREQPNVGDVDARCWPPA